MLDLVFAVDWAPVVVEPIVCEEIAPEFIGVFNY